MTDRENNLSPWKPGRIFYLGLAIVLLANWIPFIPAWYTFIHMWRVELAASVFIFLTLAFLTLRSKSIALPLSLSRNEVWLIVVPMLAFIAWSAASTLWAPSWKSAVHHTLVWSEYLIFYLLIRYLVDQENETDKLLKTATLVLVLFAIPAVVEYFAVSVIGGDLSLRARFAKYGEQIVTLLPLLIVGVARSSGQKFRVGLASVSLLWLLIYCTAGRINLLLFLCVMGTVTFLVFGLSRFHRYRKNFAICVLVFAAVPVPVYLFTLAAGSPEVPIMNRFADAGGTAYSNEFRKLMNSVSLEMFRSNPVIGIGADNYGMQFNNFREQYARLNPDDPNLIHGEMGIVGHAHNEFLQIAAELGVVGVVIFLWFMSGLLFLGFRALRRLGTTSLYPIAAVLGLAMFLASSLVSSYSFRLVQNGFIFFLVLAIAAKTLLKAKKEPVSDTEAVQMPLLALRPVFALGMVVCLMLASYSLIRVSSVVMTQRANETQDFDQAMPLYRFAMDLDNENPDVRGSLAMRLFVTERYSDSIPYFSEFVRLGGSQSVDYSYLASAQSLAGDNEAAERTMATAAVIYPRSTFVLTRHASLLHANGKAAESLHQFGRARLIDPRAANTWWTMINSGSQAASDLAFKSTDYTHIMDLQPTRSIYAVLDERGAKFPAEKSPFRR